MKRNFSKTYKSILLAAITPLFFISLSNKVNHHEENILQSNYFDEYVNREDATYINNALIPTNQKTLTDAWTVGDDPLLMENGNSLWYSSQNDNHTWELFSPEFDSLSTGIAPYRPKKAIQIENGDVFVIDNLDGWYVYSIDGTLKNSGNSTFVDQREVLQMSDGTIIILGKSGAWCSLVETSPGAYEVASSSKATGVTMYAYSIFSAFAVSDTELFFANENGGVGVALYDPATKSLSRNGIKYLDDSHGEEWLYTSLVSDVIQLTNGNIFITSTNGEYSILNLDNPENIDVIYFNDFYDENEMDNVSISTSVQMGEDIMAFTTGGDYFVTNIDGEVEYSGSSVSEDDYVAGAIVNESGSLFIGGDKYVSEYLNGYSYANDKIDLPQTKINMLTYRDSEGNDIASGESTYQEIIDALRFSVVSEFSMPMDEMYSDITLYEKEKNETTNEITYNEITDLDSVWYSDEINFKISSNGTDPKIIEETKIKSIDLEFSVAINDFYAEYASQSRVQIKYEFFIPESNPVIEAKLVSENGDVVATSKPVADPLSPQFYSGSFILENLQESTLYEGYHIQIEYKQSSTALKPILTNANLEGSTLPAFKTISDEMQIHQNKTIAETLPSGNWYEVDETTGYTTVILHYGVYDDGSVKYDPAKTQATIKEVDEYGVVTEKELIIESDISGDDPGTIVKEVTSSIRLKTQPSSYYTNLTFALNGDFNETISVPVYSENGQVLIHSRAPEEVTNPNHFAFLIIIVILSTMAVVIATVAGIVIYRKHHFHH